MGTQNCTQQNVCVADRWGQGGSSQHLTSQLFTGQQGQRGPHAIDSCFIRFVYLVNLAMEAHV